MQDYNTIARNWRDLIRPKKLDVDGESLTESYGKFAWIMDPEGNKIELWEPKDDGF